MVRPEVLGFEGSPVLVAKRYLSTWPFFEPSPIVVPVVAVPVFTAIICVMAW